MHSGIQIFTRTLLVAAAAVSLAACGNLSRNVARDGSGADRLVWPSPDSTTPMHNGGTTPTVDSVRQIRAGMTKAQIAQLIGYPHFSEGIAWGVREWDYLFRFHQDGKDIQCQYKVLFDKDKHARSFYWKPESCADVLHVASGAAPTSLESFKLSADALFRFDSAQLSADGRRELDGLLRKLADRDADIGSIHIVGYTDKFGSKAYNGLLSKQRAHAVMRYLRDGGIAGDVMTATGLGEDHPVKTGCDTHASRQTEIACLAPNRRVEVQVYGKQTQ